MIEDDDFLKRVMEDKPEDGLVTVRASDVPAEAIDWLWRGRLPMGKVSVLAGEGGLSKSMLLCWIAATVSSGGLWPNNEGRSRIGSTIILSAEDDIADTVIPRLMAAGANLHKIHLVRAVKEEGVTRTFNLQSDLQKIEGLFDSLGDVVLLILDPVTSYLGKTDSHKNADVRSVLEPLGELAARKRVSIICNNHLNKAGGGSANSRIMGSVAFTAHARAVTIVSKAPDDDDLRLYLPCKMNVATLPPGLSYRIATVPLRLREDVEIQAPRIEWESGTIDVTADEALLAAADDVEGRGAKSDAIDFLRVELEYGRVEAEEMYRRGRKAGHAVRTLKRAKQELKIISKQEGRVWYWSLPEETLSGVDTQGANPASGGQPQTTWPPEQTPRVSAENGGQNTPSTVQGANTVSLAPWPPEPDNGHQNSPENDKSGGWSVEL